MLASLPNLDSIPRFRVMDPARVARLRPLTKYIWWQTPDESLRFPSRLAAQVMNLGTVDDMAALADVLTEEDLRSILRSAEIGQFTTRSWHYWHLRLAMAAPDRIPAMPQRKLA